MALFVNPTFSAKIEHIHLKINEIEVGANHIRPQTGCSMPVVGIASLS